MEYGNMTALRAELKFIFPFLSKSSCGYLHNMSTFVLNSSLFPESPYGLHCAQILSILANQLYLEIIISSYGSESLEEMSESCSGAEWHNSYQSSLDGFRTLMEGFRKAIC